MASILLTYEPNDPHLVTKYEELGNVTIMREIDTIADYPNTEILVTTFMNPVDKKFLDWMKKLKVIATPGTGLDHIDLEECEKRGIAVLSLKGETEFLSSIPSVAELTVWMMLELLRRPHEPGRFMGNQLKGKTIGIIGAGRIGKQILERISEFEVETQFYDIDTKITVPYHCCGGAERVETLQDLLETSDIVSLNLPLNKETEDIIREREFLLMKKSAFLINTSRAQIIDRHALLNAMEQKWIAGYGTDVTRDDQEIQDLEKLQKEGYNVVLTRHIFGNTVEARRATDEFIFLKVKNYVEQNPS